MENKCQECTNCFAYKKNRCTALIEMICKTRKCSFFKTRRQYVEDLKKYPPPEGLRRNIKS